MGSKNIIQRKKPRIVMAVTTALLSASGVSAAGIADLTYVNHGSCIEITACYPSAAGELVIPDTLEELPLTHAIRVRPEWH